MVLAHHFLLSHGQCVRHDKNKETMWPLIIHNVVTYLHARLTLLTPFPGAATRSRKLLGVVNSYLASLNQPNGPQKSGGHSNYRQTSISEAGYLSDDLWPLHFGCYLCSFCFLLQNHMDIYKGFHVDAIIWTADGNPQDILRKKP